MRAGIFEVRGKCSGTTSEIDTLVLLSLSTTRLNCHNATVAFIGISLSTTQHNVLCLIAASLGFALSTTRLNCPYFIDAVMYFALSTVVSAEASSHCSSIARQGSAQFAQNTFRSAVSSTHRNITQALHERKAQTAKRRHV